MAEAAEVASKVADVTGVTLAQLAAATAPGPLSRVLPEPQQQAPVPVAAFQSSIG